MMTEAMTSDTSVQRRQAILLERDGTGLPIRSNGRKWTTIRPWRASALHDYGCVSDHTTSSSHVVAASGSIGGGRIPAVGDDVRLVVVLPTRSRSLLLPSEAATSIASALNTPQLLGISRMLKADEDEDEDNGMNIGLEKSGPVALQALDLADSTNNLPVESPKVVPLKSISKWPLLLRQSVMNKLANCSLKDAVNALNSIDHEFKREVEGGFGGERILACKGYLEKQGVRFRTWKLRYFCLFVMPPSFHYYEEKSFADEQLKQFDTFSLVSRFRHERKIRHHVSQSTVIGVVPIGNDATVLPDDSDAFAFKIVTKERTWRLKANSRSTAEKWIRAVKETIGTAGSRMIQDRGTLHKIIRSLDWCNGWFERPFEGIPFLCGEDGEYVRSKVAALTKFWLSMLDRYAELPEIKRVLETETPTIENIHSIATVLQERVALRGQLHDEFRHFLKVVSKIQPKLEHKSGFIDLKDYEDAKTTWTTLKNRSSIAQEFYTKKGGVLQKDCEVFEEEIVKPTTRKLEEYLEIRSKQIE